MLRPITGKGSAKRKFGFDMDLASRKKPPVFVPKAQDIPTALPGNVLERRTPSAIVSKKLAHTDVFIGIDIETHGWQDLGPNKGHWGKFGFYNLCNEVDLSARIVQFGWAYEDISGSNIVKEFLVKPNGFRVSAKATNYHSISHEQAMTEGRELRDVLFDFMHDLVEIVGQRGGRLACHHMEFDAGIIYRELIRCEMHEQVQTFTTIAKAGVCTMDPDIGRWVRQCCRDDSGSETTMNTMGLQAMVRRILPDQQWLLRKHHSAGADALMHLKLANALRDLVVAE